MKTFSLSLKIYFVLSIAIATAIIIGLVGIAGLSNIKENLDFANDKTLPRLINALSAQSGFRRLATAQYRMIVSENEQEKKKIMDEMETYKKHSDEDFARGLAAASEARLPLWKEAVKNFEGWWELAQEIQKLSLEGKDKEALEITKKQRPLRLETEKIFDDLVQKNKEGSKADQEEAHSKYDQVRFFLFSIILAGILISAFLAWAIMRSVMKTLNNTVQVISESTNQVASASTQIASASQQLSQASTEQASSLEETASSIEEITSMISKSTENADRASQNSNQSHKKAEEGRVAVDHMLASMDEISQSNEAILSQINDSNRQMVEIVKVIQEIGNRTKVINEIVFQTKLLSFNASVEAARAGEHGKGFAVVAEEVGNLAQMSGNAAKEITTMLESSISKVEGIVRETQQKVTALVQTGKEKVASGTTLARQCSEVLNEIVQNVSLVAGISLEIAQASKEQSQGVLEINKAMSQLDSVTQQNAATSEEAASSAEELSAQTISLKGSVEELVVVINGSKSGTDHDSASRLEPKNKSEKLAKSKVIPFRPAKSKFTRTSSAEEKLFKMAGSGDFVPRRNDDGFKDV